MSCNYVCVAVFKWPDKRTDSATSHVSESVIKAVNFGDRLRATAANPKIQLDCCERLCLQSGNKTKQNKTPVTGKCETNSLHFTIDMVLSMRIKAKLISLTDNLVWQIYFWEGKLAYLHKRWSWLPPRTASRVSCYIFPFENCFTPSLRRISSLDTVWKWWCMSDFFFFIKLSSSC